MYFKGGFKKGFLALYGERTMLMMATGFLGLFAPLFLFELFNYSLSATVLFYGLTSLFYALFVAFGAMFLNKFGFRKSLRSSLIFGSLYYTAFYFMNGDNYIYLLPLAGVFSVLFTTLHWLPYHVDFAKFSNNQDRAKQLSFLRVTRNILTGAIPIVSGFLVGKYGYDVIFAIGVVLYLCAGLFLIDIPRTKEKFDWNYFETWKNFFDKKNRSIVFAFMADGAEGFIGVIVWPIFIFQLLNGDYFQIGYLSAFIIIVTTVLQIISGKLLDKGGKKSKKNFLKFGTLLYSVGWVVKIFVLTAFHIFAAGLYHNVVKIFARTSFDTMFYDIVSNRRHYADEFTVLHEISIHLGRFFTMIFIIALSLFLSIQWTFLIAATASIVMNVLRKDY